MGFAMNAPKAVLLPLFCVLTGATLASLGFLASSILATVLMLGGSSLWLASTTTEDRYSPIYGAIFLWTTAVATLWWIFIWWLPLLLFVTLSCYATGAATRNLPQHQQMRHVVSAAVSVLTLGALGMINDRVVLCMMVVKEQSISMIDQHQKNGPAYGDHQLGAPTNREKQHELQ